MAAPYRKGASAVNAVADIENAAFGAAALIYAGLMEQRGVDWRDVNHGLEVAFGPTALHKIQRVARSILVSRDAALAQLLETARRGQPAREIPCSNAQCDTKIKPGDWLFWTEHGFSCEGCTLAEFLGKRG